MGRRDGHLPRPAQGGGLRTPQGGRGPRRPDRPHPPVLGEGAHQGQDRGPPLHPGGTGPAPGSRHGQLRLAPGLPRGRRRAAQEDLPPRGQAAPGLRPGRARDSLRAPLPPEGLRPYRGHQGGRRGQEVPQVQLHPLVQGHPAQRDAPRPSPHGGDPGPGRRRRHPRRTGHAAAQGRQHVQPVHPQARPRAGQDPSHAHVPCGGPQGAAPGHGGCGGSRRCAGGAARRIRERRRPRSSDSSERPRPSNVGATGFEPATTCTPRRWPVRRRSAAAQSRDARTALPQPFPSESQPVPPSVRVCQYDHDSGNPAATRQPKGNPRGTR